MEPRDRKEPYPQNPVSYYAWRRYSNPKAPSTTLSPQPYKPLNPKPRTEKEPGEDSRSGVRSPFSDVRESSGSQNPRNPAAQTLNPKPNQALGFRV